MPVSKVRTAAFNEKTGGPNAESASALIDAKIASLADWRGQTLARLRALIKAADAGVVEEWKWNTPVWSIDVHEGDSIDEKALKTLVRAAAGLNGASRR